MGIYQRPSLADLQDIGDQAWSQAEQALTGLAVAELPELARRPGWDGEWSACLPGCWYDLAAGE